MSQVKISELEFDRILRKKSWIFILNKITLIIGIIGPFTNIPQIVKIYFMKNVSGISLITWALAVAFDIPFIIYGIVHNKTPIAVTYSLWFLTSLIVVIGVLIYA